MALTPLLALGLAHYPSPRRKIALAAGVGVFQLGYVVSGMRGTSSSLGIESAQAYIDVFDVALVDTLAWLPGAGFVSGKQRKRLCRKAASNSAPLKVGSGLFRNEIILSR